MKNSTLFGKSFTEQTRDIMKKDLLDDKVNLYSSTGQGFLLSIKFLNSYWYRFNAVKIPRHDETLQTVSRNYGKRTMMDPSPAWRPTTNETTTQSSFKNPK